MAVQTTWGTWIGAAGTADLTAARPMTTSMQVSLAAGTKIFTAALIMRLTEAAKLALTDTVEKWLPGQVVPGGDKTAAEKITVGMLLNHTSGIHDHETTQQFEDRLFAAPTASWSNDDVLAIINAYALDFTPGAAYGYCNSNYYLLGMIAEAATGDTVENLMQARFFSPLGLSRTTLSRGGQKTAPFSRGYCWFGIPLYPDLTDTTDWDLSWDWTSGSGASTAKNMLTWLKALFGDLQVVSRKSLILMTTPQAPSTAYGYGLAVVNSDPWYNEKLYYHYGENPGVLARWFYYPTSGRIIFLSFNRDDKRFLSTDPPQQVDVNPVADNLLAGVSKLLISTGSQ
jgi:D-alanyl-D-alanine carboxypeptidase